MIERLADLAFDPIVLFAQVGAGTPGIKAKKLPKALAKASEQISLVAHRGGRQLGFASAQDRDSWVSTGFLECAEEWARLKLGRQEKCSVTLGLSPWQAELTAQQAFQLGSIRASAESDAYFLGRREQLIRQAVRSGFCLGDAPTGETAPRITLQQMHDPFEWHACQESLESFIGSCRTVAIDDLNRVLRHALLDAQPRLPVVAKIVVQLVGQGEALLVGGVGAIYEYHTGSSHGDQASAERGRVACIRSEWGWRQATISQ